MSELNKSPAETQEVSDEQKFFNLLDSESATPDEDERAEFLMYPLTVKTLRSTKTNLSKATKDSLTILGKRSH